MPQKTKIIWLVDKKKIRHTGTGRIAKMDMLPMSLWESKESNGRISLRELFDNPNIDIDGIQSDMMVEDLIFSAYPWARPDDCADWRKDGLHETWRGEDYPAGMFEGLRYALNIHKADIYNLLKVMCGKGYLVAEGHK